MSELNSTFGVTSTPGAKTMTRERQKTMVVESNIIKEIREAFARSKLQSGEELNLPQLEAVVLSSVQRYENDMTKKIKEAETKYESDLIVANGLSQDFHDQAEGLLTAVESGRIKADGGGGICGESYAKMRVDLESAQGELEDRYHEFIKLYDSYQKLRKAATLQQEEYAKLEEILLSERNKYTELKNKFLRLRDSASAQLSKASEDFSNIEREHEEKTLGLRLKNRQLENSLQLKIQELEIKKTELAQLNDIVQTLMREVQPASDDESERGGAI